MSPTHELRVGRRARTHAALVFMVRLTSRESRTGDTLEAELERARACCRRREWSEAHRLLSLADQTTTLVAEDLERLATSAYMIGRDLEFHRYLERVHYSYLRDDECHAARSAFWLGLMLMFRGETGQANGWLARARRLVAGRDCVENGYLLLPVAVVPVAVEPLVPLVVLLRRPAPSARDWTSWKRGSVTSRRNGPKR